MRKWMVFLSAVFLGFVIAVSTGASASSEYPSVVLRYKMTVEVETPEGLKSGSGIREVSMVSRPKRLGEMNDTHVKIEKGEAVSVDLGKRGILFALMSVGGGGGQAIWAPFNAFPAPCREGPISRCGIKYYSSLKSPKSSTLKTRHFPSIAYFKNIGDPKTVERVLEMTACVDTETGLSNSYCIKKDNFEAAFGAGVRLKSISVELTEDEIAWHINSILPWLKALKGYLDGQSLGGGPKLSNILEKSDFSIGE